MLCLHYSQFVMLGYDNHLQVCHPERSARFLGAESRDPRAVSLTTLIRGISHLNLFVLPHPEIR